MAGLAKPNLNWATAQSRIVFIQCQDQWPCLQNEKDKELTINIALLLWRMKINWGGIQVQPILLHINKKHITNQRAAPKLNQAIITTYQTTHHLLNKKLSLTPIMKVMKLSNCHTKRKTLKIHGNHFNHSRAIPAQTFSTILNFIPIKMIHITDCPYLTVHNLQKNIKSQPYL